MQTSRKAAAHSWPIEVQQCVQEKQERAYRNLGLKLGLGADPAKAYAHVSGARMPLSHVSSEPPTPYEDSSRYPAMAMILDQVLDAFAAAGQTVEPRPVIATLPSGQLNAVVDVEDKTHTPIIFFEQGLFQFLYDFALAIGWSVPAFRAADLNDDRALGRHRGPYTLPLGGGPFSELVHEYVVSGTTSKWVPPPEHNIPLCENLVNQMTRFVVAHEVSHYALGHSDKQDLLDDWAKEYQADANALLVLSQTAYRRRQSRGFTFWACDMCLLCLDFLDRAIGLMAFGSSPGWVSTSHPDAFSRSRRLRELLELGFVARSAKRVAAHFLKGFVPWLGFGSAPSSSSHYATLPKRKFFYLCRARRQPMQGRRNLEACRSR